MLLHFFCLLCVCNCVRVKKDSRLSGRPLPRFASRAVQRITTKVTQGQTGLLGARVLPATAALSRAFQAPPKSPWLPNWYNDDEVSFSGAQGSDHKQSPGDPWWPKGFKEGQTVRHLVTNEECVIEGFFDPKGHQVMKCVSTRDNRVLWLSPAQVSHELGETYTPPNSIKDAKGVNFKIGDNVIVTADRRYKGKQGQIYLFRGSPTRMQLKFNLHGAVEFDWYYPSQLEHAPRSD